MGPIETAVVLDRAAQLGTERGKDAASWVFDGNTSQENYRMFLRLLDDGDPEIDTVYGPKTGWLSGEWADSPTPTTLVRDLDLDEEDAEGLGDEACEAYESAAETAYWAELEAVARAQTENSDAT